MSFDCSLCNKENLDFWQMFCLDGEKECSHRICMGCYKIIDTYLENKKKDYENEVKEFKYSIMEKIWKNKHYD